MHSKWVDRTREEWDALVKQRPDMDAKTRKAIMQPPTKQLRVKSHAYRERNIELSNPNGPNFNAFFDASGVALVPHYLQPAVEFMMRWQPGRFEILPEEVVPLAPVAPTIQRIDPKDLPPPVKRMALPEPEPELEDSDDSIELDLSGVDLDQVSLLVEKPTTQLEVPKKRKGKTPKKPEME